MQVEVYRGAGRIFAFVEAEAEETLPLRYAPWTPFRTVTMVRGRSEQGVDVDDCLNDIEEYGIHVTDAQVRITERAIT
jgi:hypothetical protein